MKREAAIRKMPEERQLIKIIRRLPVERVSEVIDFAKFLELQQAKIREQHPSFVNNELSTEGDKKWDALLASDEAQQLLETMADEASNEILADNAKPMIFTKSGQLIHEWTHKRFHSFGDATNVCPSRFNNEPMKLIKDGGKILMP